jgi:hypothetical protein
MQQVTEPPAEVVLFGAGLRDDQAGVALQCRPAASALAGARAVDVFELQCLVVQEVS